MFDSPGTVGGLLFAMIALLLWKIQGLRTIGFDLRRTPPFEIRIATTLAILSFMWPAYVFFPSFIGPAFNPFTLIAFLAAIYSFPRIGRLVIGFITRKTRFRDPLLTIALTMFLWKLVYSIASQSRLGNVGFVEVVTVAIPLILLCSLKFRPISLQSLEKLVVLITFLVVAAAAVELYTQKIIVQPLVDVLARSLRAESADIAAQLASDKFRGAGLRLQSLMPHPLILGELAAILIVLLLSFSRLPHIFPTKKIKLYLWVGALAIVLIQTDSRSSLLICPVAIFTFYLLTKARKFTTPKTAFFVIGAFVAALFALVAGGFVELLVFGRNESESSSSASRLLMLTIGWARLSESPMFGYGPGTAAAIVGIRGAGDVFSLDNLFLVLALNWGLPLALLHYCFMFFLLYRTFTAALDRSKTGAEALFSGCAFSILLLHLLTGLVVSIDTLFLFSVWFATIFGGARKRGATNGHENYQVVGTAWRT